MNRGGEIMSVAPVLGQAVQTAARDHDWSRVRDEGGASEGPEPQAPDLGHGTSPPNPRLDLRPLYPSLAHTTKASQALASSSISPAKTPTKTLLNGSRKSTSTAVLTSASL